MTTQPMSQTKAILDHHLQSLAARDPESILLDYNGDAVLFTQSGPIQGTNAIHAFFSGPAMDLCTEDFLKNFTVLRRDVIGDVAYIVWQVPGSVMLGTDTFVI